MALPDSDTRLLVAGVAAVLALVAYLGVAFARTHTYASPVAPGSKVAPWTPHASKLVPVGRKTATGYTVRVTPAGRPTAGVSYGALVQTLVPQPIRGRTYDVGLWLRGARPGQIAVELNEFRGTVSKYPINTAVPAKAKWHHYTFSVRVKGSWLGLAMYVYRQGTASGPTWFAIRGLTVALRRG